jgi:hypothetical protein
LTSIAVTVGLHPEEENWHNFRLFQPASGLTDLRVQQSEIVSNCCHESLPIATPLHLTSIDFIAKEDALFRLKQSSTKFIQLLIQ